MIEMLVSLFILGMVMVGLHQVLGNALATHQTAAGKQDLLSQAHYAMDRMAMFVQASDEINDPAAGQQKSWLVVSERLLDTYNNSDRTYTAEGDGYLDADNDGDGLVNEDAGDPKEYIRFELDKTSGKNWKLIEIRPDYSTTSTTDKLAAQVLAEHVTDFQVNGLAANLVTIQLTLDDGKSRVALKTRAKAIHID